MALAQPETRASMAAVARYVSEVPAHALPGNRRPAITYDNRLSTVPDAVSQRVLKRAQGIMQTQKIPYMGAWFKDMGEEVKSVLESITYVPVHLDMMLQNRADAAAAKWEVIDGAVKEQAIDAR